MSTGYRSLLQVTQDRQARYIENLQNFSLYTFLAIQWLDIASAIVIIIVHIMLAAVIQLIEENKVRVLLMYSEVHIGDVKDSKHRC